MMCRAKVAVFQNFKLRILFLINHLTRFEAQHGIERESVNSGQKLLHDTSVVNFKLAIVVAFLFYFLYDLFADIEELSI